MCNHNHPPYRSHHHDYIQAWQDFEDRQGALGKALLHKLIKRLLLKWQWGWFNPNTDSRLKASETPH